MSLCLPLYAASEESVRSARESSEGRALAAAAAAASASLPWSARPARGERPPEDEGQTQRRWQRERARESAVAAAMAQK